MSQPARAIHVLHESDAPLDALLDKTVAMLGFGAQGHAHALNLRDSGVRVIVANRRDSVTGRSAIESGFDPIAIEDAIAQSDLIIFALPDEVQPEVYAKRVAPHLRPRCAIGFIHGFNIHYRAIEPRSDIDVIMVAPKGQGRAVREEFLAGAGVPGLFAIHQDVSNNARATALAWGRGIGCARAGLIETTFKDETETDLFGEQAVLCGGLTALMKAGFDTLVAAGYPPEIAYFECVYEVKLIVDLIHRGGIEFMRRSISNTAEFGDLTRGERIIGEESRRAMKEVLKEIQSGQFARELQTEYATGMKEIAKLAKAEREHSIERIDAMLRKELNRPGAPKPPKPRR